jgi:hypothetical protein
MGAEHDTIYRLDLVWNSTKLPTRIAEIQVLADDLWWYLDLRKYRYRAALRLRALGAVCNWHGQHSRRNSFPTLLKEGGVLKPKNKGGRNNKAVQ